MTTKLANGLVVAAFFENYSCPIAVDTEYNTTVMVSTLNCGKQDPRTIYVRQASAKRFTFTDTEEDLDFGDATAATFTVWDSKTTGSTERVALSLGSGVTAVGGNRLLVNLTGTNTGIETPQTLWWELWVTLYGDEFCIGRGEFIIEETRKNDA